MTTDESPGTPTPERGSGDPGPERPDGDDIRDAADTLDHSRLGAQLPHVDADDETPARAWESGLDAAPAGRLDEAAAVGPDSETDEEPAARPERP